MKKSCIALAFLVSASCAVFADIPTTAEEWYTPSGGFKDCEGSVEISYTEEKKTHSMVLKTDNNGSISDQDLASAQEALKHNTVATLLQFAQHIIQGENLALMNEQRIETLGKNLNSVFSASEITIDGVSPSGTPYTQTLKFKSGKLGNESGGKNIATEKGTQDVDVTDGETIEWTGGNKLRLKGWGTANSSRRNDTFKYGYGLFLGKALDKVGLQYFRMPGLASCLDVVETGTTTKPLQLQLKNWNEGYKTTCNQTAAGLITGTDNAKYTHYFLMKTDDDALHYVPAGKLEAGAACDDVSVTTNEAYGAIAGGKVSLFCYDVAPDFAIPHKGAALNGSEALDWSTLGDLVDGTSLSAKDSLIPGKKMPKLEVAGAHDYAGKSKNHYFGTSQGDGAAVGWWELPNVTTNMVVGDEATVTAGVQMPGAVFDESTKVIGLLGWNYSYNGSVPLVPVNAGGKLRYIGADRLASTNGVLCACPPKWDALLKWTECGEVKTVDEVTEDGVTNAVETIEFDPGTMTGFLKGRKFMFVDASDASSNAASVVSGQWIVNEDGVTAPTLAPGNWDDGKTIGLTSNGAFQIAGFETAGKESACGENIAAQLANGLDSHLFLAKHEETGEFHYVHAGSFTNFVQLADGMTIVTNAPSHEGELAISGAHESQNSGKALFSTGAGVVWKNPSVGVKVVGTDGSTNWVDAYGNAYTNSEPGQTITFASHTNSNVRVWVSGTKDNATVTIGVYYK